jgi:L-fuconolactonase
VVGWLPLGDPAELVRQLRAFNANPFLTGVRHLIHDEPDPHWLLRPAVADGMELIAEAGLTFDAVAETLDLLAQVRLVAERHEGLTIVIDHLGKPPMGRGEWDRWADLLAAAAERPNVTAKISGLGTISPAHRTVESWAPSIDHAIDVFGPERLMIGSDWPISTQHTSYESTISMLVGALASLEPAAREQVLHNTAAALYRPIMWSGIDSTRRQRA